MKGRFAIWWTYFFGVAKSLFEFIVTVDLSNAWRQHLVWSKKNGDELKRIVTERFASSTVFLSLLFSSELAILYSPSDPGKEIRAALRERDFNNTAYWTGVFACFAVFFSVTALVANFTAMSVFSSLSKENAPIVLRSTFGLYTAQLPSRLVTGAIYLFFAVVVMTWVLLMSTAVAWALSAVAILLLMHIVNTFSSMGRVIMESGAMSHLPILDPEEEEKLDPHELSDVLIKRVLLAKKARVPINHQYKVNYQETLRDVREGNVEWPLNHSELERRASAFTLRRSAVGEASRNLGANLASSVASAGSVAGNATSMLAGAMPGVNIRGKAYETSPGVAFMPSVREEHNESEEIQDIEEMETLESQDTEPDYGF